MFWGISGKSLAASLKKYSVEAKKALSSGAAFWVLRLDETVKLEDLTVSKMQLN